MKRTLVILICLLMVLGAMVVQSTFAKEYRFTYGDWAPFIGRDLPQGGFFTEIIIEAFKAEGHQVVFTNFPWERGKTLTAEGAYDGSCCWYFSEKRNETFLYSEGVYEVPQYFFHLKSFDFNWADLSSIGTTRIGATTGYFYGKEFEEFEIAGKILVDRAVSDEINFKKLLAGRIKLFVVGRDVGQVLLKEAFSQQERDLITYHPKILHQDPLFLIVSRDLAHGPEVIEVFNRGLGKIKQQGLFSKLEANFLNGAYTSSK